MKFNAKVKKYIIQIKSALSIIFRNKFITFNIVSLILFVFFAPYIFFILGNKYFGDVFYNRDYAKFFFHASKFSSFITMRSEIPYVNYQLGRVYFVDGQMLQALYYTDQELILYPNFKRSHYMKGLILGYTNRKLEAIEQFKIFNSQPEFKFSWAGHNDQAWLEYDLKKYQDVLTTIQKILPYHSGNPWILNTYGAALLKLNRCQEALDPLFVAHNNVQVLTPEIWGRAYPGNNPDYYEKGLDEMKQIIFTNLQKTRQCLSDM